MIFFIPLTAAYLDWRDLQQAELIEKQLSGE
jgi:hypothetical protein